MLKRHRLNDQATPLGHRTPAAPALPRIAATTLTLPAISPVIQAAFEVKASSQDSLKHTAIALVNAGILTKEHWAKGRRNLVTAAQKQSQPNKENGLATAITAAFEAFIQQRRPNPLCKLTVTVMDNTTVTDNDLAYEREAHEEYHRKYNIRPQKLGAIMVLCGNGGENKPFHAVIGHELRALEKHRPGLGHAVLHWLHQCLDKSCRALDSIDGYGWAQGNYWMGEMDESMMVEDELSSMEHWHIEEQKKLPKAEREEFDTDEARDQLDIFTRAEYDDSIPPWAGSEHSHRRPLTPDQLARLRVPARFKKIVKAAVAAGRIARATPHMATINDLNVFEYCRWEICPFLLRWNCAKKGDAKQDVLARIWDDYLNQQFEGGETNMSTNALFAFHDHASLLRALKRFDLYLQNLVAAENLIRALKFQLIEK